MHMAGEPDLQEGANDAGSSGYVSYLQQTLQYYGYYMDGAIDGIFGPITDGAVRQFQQTSGLVVDGWVGPVTWGALTGASSTTDGTVPLSGDVAAELAGLREYYPETFAIYEATARLSR